MGKRPMAVRHHEAAADQSHIREGVVGGATRAGRHQRGAVAGQAGDAVHAGGVEGFGEGHRRQDGGEPACRPRAAP
jgi:hypothetical protein